MLKGDLKRVLTRESALEPKEEREEYSEEGCHDMEGIKEDKSNVMLLENSVSKEEELVQMQRNQVMSKAIEAVSVVKTEVDKLYEKVVALEESANGGKKVADKEFVELTEMLMVQLLKLDSIKADGEAKMERRIQVGRIQSFLDKADCLKAINSNPFNGNINNILVSMKTEWGNSEAAVGSFKALIPRQSSTVVTREWEVFD